MDQKITLKVIGPNNVHGEGAAIVANFSRGERFIRSLKILGACWGLAMIAIIIPALHFLLVPLFFFGGIFGAAFTYVRTRELKMGSATCPFCKIDIPIGQSKLSWPLPIQCGKCKQELYVQDASLPVLIEIAVQSRRGSESPGE